LSDDLLLQPTANRALYEVIANKQVVGRIALFRTVQNRPWGWIAFRPGKEPVYGFEASREDAMQALTRCSVQLCSMTRARLRSVILAPGHLRTAAR
jgi:hypothetical protein